MAEPGRPTELTDELTLRIRERVLEGKKYNEIQGEIGISPNTWDTWVYKDYKNFRTDLIKWRHERMVKKAEKVLEDSLELPSDEPAFAKIKQDTAKFVTERLNKDDYSSRQENTGKDGKDLLPTPILAPLNVPTDDRHNQDSEAPEADSGNPGGNVGVQDGLNTPIIDSLGAVGSDSDPNLNSQRVLPAPEAGRDAGLPGDNGAAPVLQG